MHLAALAYAGPGDEILYSQHGFLVYPIAAHLAGATPVTAAEINLTSSVDHLLAAVTPKTKIVFLANPNNPTGSYLPQSEVIRLHRGLPPQVLLVLDAAYAEFVTEADYESGASLARAAENVMVTHTFSKIYGLAGLRLGFAYAAPAIIDALNRIRGPFNINEAASAAGIAAARDQAYIAEIRRKIAATRAGFCCTITAIRADSPAIGRQFYSGRFRHRAPRPRSQCLAQAKRNFNAVGDILWLAAICAYDPWHR